MSALKMDFNGIDTEPKLRLVKKQAITIKANRMKDVVYVFFNSNYSKA